MKSNAPSVTVIAPLVPVTELSALSVAVIVGVNLAGAVADAVDEAVAVADGVGLELGDGDGVFDGVDDTRAVALDVGVVDGVDVGGKSSQKPIPPNAPAPRSP